MPTGHHATLTEKALPVKTQQPLSAPETGDNRKGLVDIFVGGGQPRPTRRTSCVHNLHAARAQHSYRNKRVRTDSVGRNPVRPGYPG